MNRDHFDDQPETGFQKIGDFLGGMQKQLFEDYEPEVKEEKPAKTARKKAEYKPANELVKAASEIKGLPSWAERKFFARELVQCNLPLRNPGNATVWSRKNGNYTLIIQSGIDENTMQPRGLPYGEWARLFLLWIMTEAKRTKSRHVKLGRSFTNFVRLVGGDPDKGGGQRGDAKRLKDQMLRLLDCNIDFRYTEGNDEVGGREKLPMGVAPKHRLWWNLKNPNQDSLFESELILGEDFFDAIMKNPVEIDLRVVVALKTELNQASFAIDLYIWAKARIERMRHKGIKEIVIPLETLEQQFGAEFTRTLDFKRQLKRRLNEVSLFFPALDHKFVKGNFHLIDAGDNALSPATKAAQKRLKSLQPHKEVSHRTRSRFVRAYPDHQVEEVLEAFYEWLPTANTDPANINAFFWTFAGTWTKNNPPK